MLERLVVKENKEDCQNQNLVIKKMTVSSKKV
jgi:hypothetical protein